MTTNDESAVQHFTASIPKILAALSTFLFRPRNLSIYILFPLLLSGTLSQAQTNSVLVRGEITEKSPKFYEKLTFTQQIPMKTGELVVVFAKSQKGMRETHYSFIPKNPKVQQPTKWEDAKWEDTRGSRWLFPDNNSTHKVIAKPTKGGTLEPFDLAVVDETTLYVAKEDGILNVQMRSTNAVSLFFLMGKAFVGPPKISKQAAFKSTDPKTEKQSVFHQYSHKTQAGKGLLINIHGNPKHYFILGLSVTDPQGIEHKMFPDYSSTKRVYIASTLNGEYVIKPEFSASPKLWEKLQEDPYTLEVTELPDIPLLLGIKRASVTKN